MSGKIFDIHADVVLAPHGVCFMGHTASFSHIFVETLHYWAATQPRGKSACYAYVKGQAAVEIQWIFKVDLKSEDQEQLSRNIAIVRPFVTDEYVPVFP